jgi:4-hydroxybenzoate polyprenyltransferase
MLKSVKNIVAGWLTLARLPNLLTVPGDPLAGYLLVTGTLAFTHWLAVAPLMGSALMLYLAGMLGNDYCDRTLDAVERPERPLPMGLIPPRAVWAVAWGLTFAGVGCAGWVSLFSGGVAAVLAVLIWLYNGGVKRSAIWGPLNMGACRGASLLLGGSLAGPKELFVYSDLAVAVVGYVLLVAIITRIARDETRLAHPGLRRLVPGCVTALVLLRLAWPFPLEGWGDPLFGWMMAGLTAIWMLAVGVVLPGRKARPEQTRQAIGQWISGFLLWQATLCVVSGYPSRVPSMILVAAFPIYGWVARRFKGS